MLFPPGISFSENIWHRSDDSKLQVRSLQTFHSSKLHCSLKGTAFWSEEDRRRDSRRYPHCSPALSGPLLCTHSERRVWKLWILFCALITCTQLVLSLSKCHLIKAPACSRLAGLHVWVLSALRSTNDLSVECTSNKKLVFHLSLVAVLTYLVALGWVQQVRPVNEDKWSQVLRHILELFELAFIN